MKILTIIIPSYNMEKLLGRCIESLLPDKLNNIEIIIVNDGSKDNTLLVANEYKGNYPDVIVVIDKPNGNYGSCINEGLKVAKGKYVKIIDADDWVDSKSFKSFVEKLQETNSDLVLTNFNYILNDKEIKEKSFSLIEGNYELEPFQEPSFWEMEMHAISYKTEVLKHNHYYQTEGISYTDQEWIFFPMQYVKTVSYYNINVYQYFLGREGQTMDPKIENQKIHNKVIVLKNMILFYKNLDKDKLVKKIAYFDYRFYRFLRSIYKNYILLQEDESKQNELKDLDNFILLNIPKIHDEMNQYKIHETLLPIKFIKNWRKKNSRASYLVRFLNNKMKILQNIMS